MDIQRQVISGAVKDRWNVKCNGLQFQILGVGNQSDIVITDCDIREYMDSSRWVDLESLSNTKAVDQIASAVEKMYNTKIESQYLIPEWNKVVPTQLRREKGTIVLEAALLDADIIGMLQYKNIPSFKITTSNWQQPTVEFSNAGLIAQKYEGARPGGNITADPTTWLELYRETVKKLQRQILIDVLRKLYGDVLDESVDKLSWLNSKLFSVEIPESYPYSKLPSVHVHEDDRFFNSCPVGSLLDHITYIKQSVSSFNDNDTVLQT